MMKKIAVLITSHNRKRKTLSCLRALYENKMPKGFNINVFLVDDGSTDGTSEAIKNHYPKVHLIKGNGNLYWNRGMLLAWETAIKHRDYDFYLWLNDDTILMENALSVLLESFQKAKTKNKIDAIIVGSTMDKNTKELTYGGRIKKHRFDFFATKSIFPDNEIKPINTFNGNIVLVSKNIYKKNGLLDSFFWHGIGDIDYGLRANKERIPMFIAPGFLGYCSNNAEVKKWINPKIPFVERWRDLNSPKGFPLSQWKRYVKKHTGILWPVFYLKVIMRVLFPYFW